MKKLLLALALLFIPSLTWAQCNGVFPNNTACGNISGGSNTPRPIPLTSFPAQSPGGANGATQYNNSGLFGGYTPNGDITVNPTTGVETIQPGVVSNSKLATGGANTVKGSTDGVSTTDITFTTILNTVCSLSPSTCSTIFGYTYTAWYGAVCDGTTDDTTKLQAAITGTPLGGTLYIQPSGLSQGCLIKGTTTVGSVTYNLIVNHQMNIRGGGFHSWIKTDASIGNTVVNIYAPITANPWDGTTWSGFQLSANGFPFARPYTRFGGRGIWFDATTGGASGFSNLRIDNIMIGESGHDYSFYLDGVSSTLNHITNSVIWGGLYLFKVADSNVIDNNQLAGVSPLGVIIDCSATGSPIAGDCQYTRNSTTATGGFILDAGTWVIIENNYFEEIGTVTFARNAFIDLRGSSGAIQGTHILNNIIGDGISTTSLAILIGTNGAGTVPTSTYIGGNLIANGTARTGVNNFGTGTNCTGINTWPSTTHVSGTGTLTNAIGTTVSDCP